MADQDDLKPRRLSIDDEAQRYPLEKMTRGGQRRHAKIQSIHDKAGRVPPQAVDVEQSVLGAMLIEREAIPRAVEILPPDAFYTSKHQQIFTAILSLFERGNPVDLITLTEELRRRNELDDVGGPYYLTELTTQVASAANVEYHARIIAEKSLLRKMIETMTELVGQAYDTGTDAFELLDKAEADIFHISDSQLRKSASSITDVIKETLQKLEAIHGREGGITGVPSGFTRLDDMTSGWQRSDLIIIAARPSMGKCLGRGTPVMMYDGTVRPVEDVRVGDRLMGDDGTPRTVRSLARGREMMYWVRQAHAMDYRVNESHILSLKPHGPEGAVADLSVRDFLQLPAAWRAAHRGFKVAVPFPEQPLPMAPYLFGRQLQEADEEATTPAAAQQAAGGGAAVTVPAALARIPHAYIANTRAHRLALLAGLIDGDPLARTPDAHGAYVLTCASRSLAEQVKYLCDTLGFRTALQAAGQRYHVHLCGNVGEIPVRRAPAVQGLAEDWRLTPLCVEPDRVDDYYGFVLDGNRRFLLADGTVTHNTAFSLACARNAALHPQYPTGVAYFSLEMGAQQLAQRLLTSEARIDAQAARTGRMTDRDWQQLARAAGKLSAAPIYIDDTPGLSVLELRAKCRRLKAEHDIGLVVVDYLQLMHGTASTKNSNREQEIAHISRSLKSLAKELNVPVIALSQLSRAVETRGGDKRPQLSDLRESGCLTGETLVALAETGERVPLRTLAGRAGFTVWALNPETRQLEAATVSRAFSTGIKPVFRMTTRRGRTIRATANHQFLTPEGWQRLDALAPGARLALPRRPVPVPALAHAGDLAAETRRPPAYAPPHTAAADSYEEAILWDPIVSIEPDGVEEVFDLTVPGPHNFVANDIIVHNSIEQDADIVCFIYRAERYGITQDEMGNSTEGTSEIIIGKQRNGPIGSVQLAFVNQYARFENLTTYYNPDGGGVQDYQAPQAPMPSDDAAPF